MAKNNAFKININTCGYEDLRVLPGVGQVIADRIWELRKQGPIDLETFAGIPKLRITPDLLECIDFLPSLCIDHSYAKPTSDGMEEYFTEFQDQDDHGEVNIEHKMTDGTAKPSTHHRHTATPLSVPRRTPLSGECSGAYHAYNNEKTPTQKHSIRNSIQPSAGPATCRSGEQENSPYNIEVQRPIPDHVRFQSPATQRRTLPSPQLSPTFARRNLQAYTPSRPMQREYTKPVFLPKTLRYDGSSNWGAFFIKFTKYADASHWTTAERQDQLCWCLDGKASDFYTNIISRNQNIDYFDLVRKMEKRFNFVDLPETLQVQFLGAHQNVGEKLEDWADRLLSLATKAFCDLPENHAYSQAILRLCQGCCDKEAGQHAAMSRPQTIEEAIDKIKWYQHTKTAIFGKSVRQRTHFSDSDEEEPERSINAVTTDNKERRHHYHSDKSDQLKSMEDQIKILVDNMQLLQSKLNSIESKAKEKAETRTCYNCYRQGHIAKDCKKPRRQFPRTQNRTDNSNSPAQTRRQPLNDNGSDQQA